MTRWSAGGLALVCAFSFISLTAASASGNSVETIVFIRHGEKPAAGLGQLDCQGLNRALALPAVIIKDFGRPDALFAPNPSDEIDDGGTSYDYVRPLATIEPTAVSLGLPVNTNFGYSDDAGLEGAVIQPAYRNAVIFVTWEHKQIERMVTDLLNSYGGDSSVVPKWHGNDFDSAYVVKIAWAAGTGRATFELGAEGLNGQLETCPSSAH